MVASFVCGATFVGSLYIGAGPSAFNRNNPSVIKDRFVRIGVASLFAPWVASCTVLVAGCDVVSARWFGLWTESPLTASLVPLALTMWLFAGPLVMEFLDRDRFTPLRTQLSQSCATEGQRLQALRNLLIGPLAEEWVFRACMCPMLHGAGLSDAACVFYSAAVFGAAHIHHRFDSKVDWLSVAVQFTYTFLFGAYSSYLFLRTGFILGPFLAHVFCNFMGLPDFAGGLRQPLTAAAFVVGLGGFIAFVVADALYRPALFASPFWEEN